MKPKFKVGDRVKLSEFARNDPVFLKEEREGKILEVVKETKNLPKDLKIPYYYVTDGVNGNWGIWEEFLELDTKVVAPLPKPKGDE